jgi:hypothetical protein
MKKFKERYRFLISLILILSHKKGIKVTSFKSMQATITLRRLHQKEKSLHGAVENSAVSAIWI